MSNGGNNGSGAYRMPNLTPEQAAAARRSEARENARRSRNLYVTTSKGYMEMERQKALQALSKKLSPYKGSKNNRNTAIRALEAARKGARANRNVNRQKVANWGQRITSMTSNTNKALYKKMRQYYISELNTVMNKRTGNSRAVKRLEAFAGFKRALGRGVARTKIYGAYGARGLAKTAAAPVRGAALTGRGATGLLQRMKLKAFAMRKKRSPSNYNASVAWKAHVLKLRRKQEEANRKVVNMEANLKRYMSIGIINNSELNRVRSKLNSAKRAAKQAKELANNARRGKTIPALIATAPNMPKSGNRRSALTAEAVAPGVSRRASVSQLAGLFNKGPPLVVRRSVGGRSAAINAAAAVAANNARKAAAAARAAANAAVNAAVNTPSRTNNNAAARAEEAASVAENSASNFSNAVSNFGNQPRPRQWIRNPFARR